MEDCESYGKDANKQPKGTASCAANSHSGKRGSLGSRASIVPYIEPFFWAWFNNRMTVVLIAVQSVRLRDSQSMMRIRFFLDDLEHHFVDGHAAKTVWDAFRYLKRYFEVYPKVTLKQCKRALEMVGRIYAILGMNLSGKEKSCKARNGCEKTWLGASENAAAGSDYTCGV
jgi:hypothetical protein